MYGRIITLVVFIAIILVYVVYNTQAVEVKFLCWETQASTALVTLGAFLAGVILGFIIAKIDQFNKEKKKKARQKKRKKEGR